MEIVVALRAKMGYIIALLITIGIIVASICVVIQSPKTDILVQLAASLVIACAFFSLIFIIINLVVAK